MAVVALALVLEHQHAVALGLGHGVIAGQPGIELGREGADLGRLLEGRDGFGDLVIDRVRVLVEDVVAEDLLEVIGVWPILYLADDIGSAAVVHFHGVQEGILGLLLEARATTVEELAAFIFGTQIGIGVGFRGCAEAGGQAERWDEGRIGRGRCIAVAEMTGIGAFGYRGRDADTRVGEAMIRIVATGTGLVALA